MRITFRRKSQNLQKDITYQRLTNVPLTINIEMWPTVPNHIRCYVQYSKNTFTMIPYTSGNRIKDKLKKLALIVESPHKDEFDGNFNPLVPLNGRSGLRFDDQILNKIHSWLSSGNGRINDIDENDIIQITIFNPIQFQTSLYHLLNNKIPYTKLSNSHNQYKLNKTLRDGVWKILYIDLKYEDDFIDELRAYDPEYIINCCTGSYNQTTNVLTKLSNIQLTTSTELNAIVKNSIVNNLSNFIPNAFYIDDTHPLTW